MDAPVAARAKTIPSTRRERGRRSKGKEAESVGGFTAEDVRRKDANETRGGGGGGEGEDASIARDGAAFRSFRSGFGPNFTRPE